MIWVIGCNGMLGREICRELNEKQIDFIKSDIDVDITDIEALRDFSKGKSIEWIINCAAYTAVDKAESDVELCRKLNTDAPGNIAKVSNEIGAKIIHISTDYVFDVFNRDGGLLNFSPLKEDDSICPNSVYGSTKAEGEKSIIQNTDRYYILRTAWLYGWEGKNFVYTMIHAMNTHDSIKVVNDQKGTPTFAGDLTNAIISIVTKNCVPFGIYHFTDLGEITWWDFANEIKQQGILAGWINETGKKCVVNPCKTEEYPTPAKRPAYSVLCKDKIQSALNYEIPDWKSSLVEFLKSPFFDSTRI